MHALAANVLGEMAYLDLLQIFCCFLSYPPDPVGLLGMCSQSSIQVSNCPLGISLCCCSSSCSLPHLSFQHSSILQGHQAPPTFNVHLIVFQNIRQSILGYAAGLAWGEAYTPLVLICDSQLACIPSDLSEQSYLSCSLLLGICCCLTACLHL